MTNRDYKWFIEQDFGQYANKWIAVINKKVVGSSDNVNLLIEQVQKEYPNKMPLITKIRQQFSIL